METKNPAKLLWKVLSLIFVLYGYYLFFWFCVDITYRVFPNLVESMALSFLITACLMGFFGFLWYKGNK